MTPSIRTLVRRRHAAIARACGDAFLAGFACGAVFVLLVNAVTIGGLR